MDYYALFLKIFTAVYWVLFLNILFFNTVLNKMTVIFFM